MGCGLPSSPTFGTNASTAILASLNFSVGALGSHRYSPNRLACNATTTLVSTSVGIHSRLLSTSCHLLNVDGYRKYGLLGTKPMQRGHQRTSTVALAGGFFGFGKKKTGFGKKKTVLPEIVQAGDPVLHECAAEVAVDEIGSESIQKIIDDMIAVMWNAPGCGLAAPQLGVPLQIIVLEDKEEYIRFTLKEETEAQERHPFDLLIIINPKLKSKGIKTAKFFEGCLSVNGFRGLVERHLEVEVTGFGRDGLPIKVNATGWKARILQHECDHLAGLLYVDKLIPRTFRTVENFRLPLATGCPKPGVD
jgi:peptide deformylase